MSDAALQLDGLADARLQGRVRASRYAPVTTYACAASYTPVLAEPGGAQTAELLLGERFDALTSAGEHAFGLSRRDGAIGWIALADLRNDAPAPTHRVSSPGDGLELNALISVTPSPLMGEGGPAEPGRMGVAPQPNSLWADPIGWVDPTRLTPLDAPFERDPGAVAERLLGTPHRPGGRSSAGIDAVGLIQQALYACGLAAPRALDALTALGRPAEEPPRRGDLLVWPNHAALLLDADRAVDSTPRVGVAVSLTRTLVERLGHPSALRRLL